MIVGCKRGSGEAGIKGNWVGGGGGVGMVEYSGRRLALRSTGQMYLIGRKCSERVGQGKEN